MPLEGYTRHVRAHAWHHPNITVRSPPTTATSGALSLRKGRLHRPDRRVLRLPVRPAALSLTCASSTKRIDREQFQPAPVVNYPNDHEYTRITEFKYLTGQEHPKTSIVYEYPTDEGDPYYPIPRPENAELYERYRALAPRRRRRVLLRPPRQLPLLQHGPGGGAGAALYTATSRTTRLRLEPAGTSGRHFIAAARRVPAARYNPSGATSAVPSDVSAKQHRRVFLVRCRRRW